MNKEQEQQQQHKFKRLREVQEECLEEVDSRLSQWTKYVSDYEKLAKQLESLPDEISHKCMVPFGSKAFMPGNLVHTNEILVLLGDNWFVERSAKQAREIVARRIKQCEEMIEKFKAEKEQYVEREKFVTEFEGGDGGEQGEAEGESPIEIGEEITEGEHQDWMRRHEENVKAERQARKMEEQLGESEITPAPNTDTVTTDMLAQFFNIPTCDSSSDSEASDDNDDGSKGKKSVHWLDKVDVSGGDVPRVQFKHSGAGAKRATAPVTDMSQLHPGNVTHYSREGPVSILRQTSHDTSGGVEIRPLVGDVVESSPLVGDVMDSRPLVGDVVESRPFMGDVVASRPLGDVVESRPLVGDVMDSRPLVGDVVESKPLMGDVVVSRSLGDVVESRPLVGDVVESTPLMGDRVESKPVMGDVVESRPLMGDVVESRPLVGDMVESRPLVVDDVVESKPLVGDVVESRPLVGDVVESRLVGDVVESRPLVGDVVESRLVGDVVESRRPLVGDVVESRLVGDVVESRRPLVGDVESPQSPQSSPKHAARPMSKFKAMRVNRTTPR